MTNHTVAVNEPAREFSIRLARACDEADVPPLNRGRLVWIRKGFGQRGVDVTTEGVRKWFAGVAFPGLKKVRILSEMLDVDQGWLAYGANLVGVGERPARFHRDAAQNAPDDRGRFILDRIRERLGGTVTVMPGVDLTEPTGEVWDAERD